MAPSPCFGGNASSSEESEDALIDTSEEEGEREEDEEDGEEEEHSEESQLHQALLRRLHLQPEHPEVDTMLRERGCKDLADALDVALGEKEDPNSAHPLDGNIYRFFAFYPLISQKTKSGQSLLTMPKERFSQWIMFVGMVLIFLIQLIAPIAIFATELRHLITSIQPGAFRTWTKFQWLTVLLAWAFLFCFILKAFNEARSDANTSIKTCRLATYLKKKNLPVYECMLIVDALINSYVAILLSMCMFTILFREQNAKDIVFDALSLVFILNVDDIASELGFLGDVWSDEKMGVLYKALDESGAFEREGIPGPEDMDRIITGSLSTPLLMRIPGTTEVVVVESNTTTPRTLKDDDDDDEDEQPRHSNVLTYGASAVGSSVGFAEKCLHKGPPRIYRCTKWVLMLLLIIAIPSPFIFSSEAKDWDVNDITHMGDLIKQQQESIATQKHGHGAKKDKDDDDDKDEDDEKDDKGGDDKKEEGGAAESGETAGGAEQSAPAPAGAAGEAPAPAAAEGSKSEGAAPAASPAAAEAPAESQAKSATDAAAPSASASEADKKLRRRLHEELGPEQLRKLRELLQDMDL